MSDDGNVCSGATFHRENRVTEIDGITCLESVCGLLEITLDKETLVTGVAFRAGDKYVITPYHIFRGCIEQIAENIAYYIDEKMNVDDFPSENFPKIPPEHDKNTRLKNNLDFLHTPPRMHIGKLIKKFEGIDPKGYGKMRNMLNERWHNGAVKVTFGKSVISLSPDIPFFDKDHDVIILQIKNSTVPLYQLRFEAQAATPENVDVIGYSRKDKDTHVMAIDRDCKVYQSGDKNIVQDVKEAVEFWTKEDEKIAIDESGHDSKPLDFEEQFTLPDPSKGRFVLHTSHPFVEGTSGSPIVSVETVNEKKILVVHGMYMEGYPPFYYTLAQSLKTGKVLPEKDRNLNKYKEIVKQHEDQRKHNKGSIPFRHFFEVGISMKKIALLLDQSSCQDIKDQIFSATEDMTQVMEKLADEYEKVLNLHEGNLT